LFIEKKNQEQEPTKCSHATRRRLEAREIFARSAREIRSQNTQPRSKKCPTYKRKMKQKKSNIAHRNKTLVRAK